MISQIGRQAGWAAGCGIGVPHSVDRTRSPIGVSQKREYFKYPPETIGNFAPTRVNCGVRRLAVNSEKPAIGGHFSGHWGYCL
jgi:hypothetical protein